MTQRQLANIFGNQCARYGEPSAYRAIAALNLDPRLSQLLNEIADERAAIYRAHRGEAK